jgi:hypothetical protein
MSLKSTIIFAFFLAIAGSGLAEAADNGAGVARVAFFGFRLINTSLEPVSADENRRIRMLDEILREKLGASGRFRIVEFPAATKDKIAASSLIGNCNGCEIDFAKETGADLAAWGTVQKVSNLILNINLYMENAQDGALTFLQSVDIRGNTDESWRRGLNYMIKNHLIRQPEQPSATP